MTPMPFRFARRPHGVTPPALLVLTLAAFGVTLPAQAQQRVLEDSVTYIADRTSDDAPAEITMDPAWLPVWSVEQATELLSVIEKAGTEGLFPADYGPEALATAILGGPGTALDDAATQRFLLLATHMRDGRTPNRARVQWFVTDTDADNAPLLPLLHAALAAADTGAMAAALAGLNPVHGDFAALRDALATAPDAVIADRIRVNMERWRWMPRDLGQRYIVSNVPEYLTRVIDVGRVIATHKAVMGKLSTATPQLDAVATAVIINPTWTLPRSIINEGIGNTIATNPDRARAEGYRWTGSGRTLSVVQAAGPGNALGMMKLEMLNPHAIYLHDTPSQAAFGAATRAYSHGCIRTERALHFSGLMAVRFADKTPEEFGAAVASGKTTRLAFAEPFPVYVGYWTMARAGDGTLATFKDLYGRDAPVIASFARPPRPPASVVSYAARDTVMPPPGAPPPGR